MRPVLEVGQDHRGDLAVVVEQVALCVAFLRPEDLVAVGQHQGRFVGLERGARAGPLFARQFDDRIEGILWRLEACHCPRDQVQSRQVVVAFLAGKQWIDGPARGRPLPGLKQRQSTLIDVSLCEPLWRSRLPKKFVDINGARDANDAGFA